MPGGVNSNVRLDAPPIVFERGRGARLWDVDGREYIDYLLGQGPAFLGHAPPEVLSAVEEACRRGMVFGAQHPLEITAADAFCAALGWPDMVRFSSSGSEAVQAALRLARGVTGRRLVIRFEGHYHGWFDNIFVGGENGRPVPLSAGQDPDAFQNLLVLPWNDLRAVEDAFAEHPEAVAAVLMEPMMLNAGAVAALPGYLEAVKQLCEQEGAVLIFDEVITGFRLALGGAAEEFGVTPHLATYGKAMASGWPVAALAGEERLMSRLAEGIVHAGTFNANIMAAAATAATLRVLQQPDFYTDLAAVGDKLMAGLTNITLTSGLPIAVRGRPAAFHVSFDQAATEPTNFKDLARADVAAYHLLADLLFTAGLWVARRGIWYVSAAHSDSDVDETLERFSTAVSQFTAHQSRDVH